jgi:hypothetical protein
MPAPGSNTSSVGSAAMSGTRLTPQRLHSCARLPNPRAPRALAFQPPSPALAPGHQRPDAHPPCARASSPLDGRPCVAPHAVTPLREVGPPPCAAPSTGQKKPAVARRLRCSSRKANVTRFARACHGARKRNRTTPGASEEEAVLTLSATPAEQRYSGRPAVSAVVVILFKVHK